MFLKDSELWALSYSGLNLLIRKTKCITPTEVPNILPLKPKQFIYIWWYSKILKICLKCSSSNTEGHKREKKHNTIPSGLGNRCGGHPVIGTRQFWIKLTHSDSSSSEIELAPSSSVDNWIRERLLSAKRRVRRLSRRRWRLCEHTMFRIALRNEWRPASHT
jgi:hypothetical protein